jgi:hypothetical protein
MKFIRYAKYTGEPADAIDLEELVKRLGDFFLQSGFESQFYGVSQMDPEHSMKPFAKPSSAPSRKATCFPRTPCPTNSAKCSTNPVP